MGTKADRGGLGRVGLLAGGALMALTALTAVAAPVAARGGDSGVRRHASGVCTRSGDWELELEKEHGRIQVSVAVHGHRAGRPWRVRIYHDGALTANVLKVANTRGRLRIDRTRNDRTGVDRFRFRAVDQVNGRVCAGALSI
jgi:hypothetical protein